MGGTVTVAGTDVRVEATGALAIQDGQLSFRPAGIQLVGCRVTLTVPQAVLDTFRDRWRSPCRYRRWPALQLDLLEIGTGTATLRAELAEYLLTGDRRRQRSEPEQPALREPESGSVQRRRCDRRAFEGDAGGPLTAVEEQEQLDRSALGDDHRAAPTQADRRAAETPRRADHAADAAGSAAPSRRRGGAGCRSSGGPTQELPDRLVERGQLGRRPRLPDRAAPTGVLVVHDELHEVDESSRPGTTTAAGRLDAVDIAS